MRACRSLVVMLLFLSLVVLHTTLAQAQSPKSGQDAPPPRRVVDPKEVDDLKKALTDLQTKIAADAKQSAAKIAEAVKAASDAKSAGGADSKTMGEKVGALEKATADLAAIKGEVFDDKNSSKVGAAATTGRQRGDTAWMLTASAFVMFMVPGLALFYCGMVRRKNVLATMMHSMAALAVVGVYWIIVGYSLAFGPSAIKIDFMGVKDGGLVGWSWDLFFLQGIEATQYLGQYDVPVYVHVMFQGMFAILTPALISGAIAERIRFWPFCIFMLLWVTFVYCPLAHMVWAFDWFDTSVLTANRGKAAIGLLGKMGALDFAGGTVVHIAAGMAGLACVLVLGKRAGYPKLIAHPNSMVLTLLGAGLLWFGWFGFNGGSAVNGSALAGSAFAATQAAAAAAGLGWMLIERIHKGKSTALGLASGIVAGLVAVTPASGFVYMWGGAIIGFAAAILCYLAVALKNKLGYDDSLDAFGVHGVGGFVGAVLTGVFCSSLIQSASADGPFAYSAHRSRLAELEKDSGKLIKEAKTKAEEAGKAVEEAEAKLKTASESEKADAEKAVTEAKEIKADKDQTVSTLEDELKALQKLAATQDDKEHDAKDKKSAMSQVFIQLKAAIFSVVFAFVLSLALCGLTQAITGGNFKTDEKGESLGLDRTEHDEVGFDFSAATESVTVVTVEPRAAAVPRGNGRFDVQLTGADASELMKVWSALCQPSDQPADPNFLAVYPHVTTIRGTTFRCRGGDPADVAKRLSTLFTKQLGKEVNAAKVA